MKKDEGGGRRGGGGGGGRGESMRDAGKSINCCT